MSSTYEFTFDSDDWINNDSPPPTLPSFDQDPDTVHPFNPPWLGEPKSLLSPGPNLAVPHVGASPGSSLSSPQDSFSDSASSKRTRSSASPHTGSSGDTVMTDGMVLKQDWDVSDFLHVDGNHAVNPGSFDGTVNPKSIQQGYGLDEHPGHMGFDFHSDSSPSPDRNVDAVADATGGDFGAPKADGAKSTRRHIKAFSQYSLTQSMYGLKTNGSREVSPVPGYVFSQDSSPSALFNSSPSPGPAAEFGSGHASRHDMEVSHYAHGLPTSPPLVEQPPAYAGSNIPPPYVAGTTGHSAFRPQIFENPRAAYRLVIDRTPVKSRVETQIPIKMRLCPLPPGIKKLHLPTHTISKPKLLHKGPYHLSPDTLELSTSLVCTSAMQGEKNKQKALARARAATTPPADPAPDGEDEDGKPANGGEIWICKGCIQRERKRADRKKSKKPDEEENWRRDEHRRVIVFNTHEIKEWQAPESQAPDANCEYPADGLIEAPMRIACYCRHHGEKVGFQVIFTIKDCMGQVVAQAFSDNIMITDDHKTHVIPHVSDSDNLFNPLATAAAEPAAPPPRTAFRPSHSTSDLAGMKRQSVSFPPSLAAGTAQAGVPTPRNLSRPASPGAQAGPSNKKRKSNNSAKLPPGLAMTRLETAQVPVSQPPGGQISTAGSAVASPFSPSLPAFPASDPLLGHNAALAGPVAPATVPSFANGPPTPNSNSDQLFFTSNNRSASLDNLGMTQMYSAPASSHASRAPSPTGLRSSVSAMQQQAQLAQSLQNQLFPLQMGMGLAAASPVSIINKIIPAEGPKSGGIEVTILGQGFYTGLEVMFGDQKATTTTFWGQSSLVCLVPPSATPGIVPVTLKQPNRQLAATYNTTPLITFRYVGDDEHNLLRTALTVLSRKMNGKLEDVQDVARRIIGDSASWTGTGSGGGAGSSTGGGFASFSAGDANFESQLLKVLELIDLDDSTNKPRLNLQRRATGQSMLHLACATGLHRFVAGLLARGANTDLRDNGGYTPMHLAALNNQPEIVRRLIYAGADPTIRTLSGETAADVARSVSRSREVLLAMQRIERHARNKSSTSLYSRASSATSLKSLWEQPKNELASAEYNTDSDSGPESPEYSRYATSEEGGDEDDGWLDMRRSSLAGRRALDISPAPLLAPADADVPAAVGSPAAAVLALKEHLAQMQQFIAQLPGSITMPPNPLPDYYQAYLNSATFQRLSSFVPNMGGSRPGTASGGAVPREMEGRWWDVLMPSTASPPAYDEIFPRRDAGLDTKQATAAAAAAEAEADVKCAGLYDRPSTTAAPARQLPTMLQIGRKNAITREQRETFQRVHAERRKGLGSDTSLYMIWIPILLAVLLAQLYPGVFLTAFDFIYVALAAVVRKTQQAVGPAVGRVVQNLEGNAGPVEPVA